MSKGQPKDVVINMRATKEQRDLIDWAAHEMGLSRSEFILRESRQQAVRVLGSHPVLVQP